MPRFFNRIRKQLAKENKFLHYSRYAIGEILLVVAGILIALQIDNWNEEKKNLQKGKEYMARLSEELEIDRRNMKLNLAFYQDVTQYGQMALEYSEKGLQEGQTHWEMLVAFFQAGQIWPLQQGTSTYEELKSAGDFALVQNPEIRKDLIFYYGQGALSYSQTVGINPPYRKMVRGRIPVDLQNYMWDSCHVTLGVIQYMKPCLSPVFEEDAELVLQELAADRKLLEELRYFMSNIRAGMPQIELQRDRCEKILANILRSAGNNPD